MNEYPVRLHWSFWLVGIVTLIWNLLGALNFLAQMDPDMVASYRESERAIILGRPLWASAGFALAVFAGSLGNILLLLRKSLAIYLFIASLLGVLVTMAHTLSRGIQFAAGEIVGIIVLPVVVAAFLVWYARYSFQKSWIK